MTKKIVILSNEILTNTPDELDVIHQVELVKKACVNLGHEVVWMTVGADLLADVQKVKTQNADLVFNLVEATFGLGELIYFTTALLNSMKIPYTGVPLDALFVTTSKVLAKKLMRNYNLPTAGFYSINEIRNLDPQKIYIAKPVWEEASVGISADSVFTLSETEKIEKIQELNATHYFIEEFIEGREFNVSLLAGENGVEVLPPAEMIFSDYFDNKPKIVGYQAKWDENSEEYKQTNRAFGTLKNDPVLAEKLVNACKKTWDAFNLKGYVRIDFRVDNENNIFILEINGNPCISPDSGFVAAVEQAGYSVETMVKRILNDVN